MSDRENDSERSGGNPERVDAGQVFLSRHPQWEQTGECLCVGGTKG